MKFVGWGVLAVLAVAAVARAGELLPAGVNEDTLGAAPALVRIEAQPILLVRLKTVRNTVESRDLISGTFTRIWTFARAHGIKVVGSPLEIMSRYEEADGSWLLAAAIPIELPAAGVNTYRDAGDIQFGEIGGGEAAQAAHRGAHERIKETHERVAAFLATRGIKADGRIAEQHFDNPHTVAEEKLRSSVTFFLK